MTTQTQTTRDSFGSRVGSKASAINAALTGKPQTVREISDALSLDSGFVYNRLKDMVAKGQVEKSDDGYKLAGVKKPAKKRDRKAEKARRAAKLAAQQAPATVQS